MPILFTNINLVWASVLVETLHRLGVQTAVVCPGSRSAPLAVAIAQHPSIHAIPVLDERSAAFFALGMARASKRPTLLVCTSGTAGANFYPAVIEAYESRVPLIVLTADRPPELRHCNAGQAIDQQQLFGRFTHWFTELSLPSLNCERLAYLRQTIVFAWERSQFPVPGVVHLNLPFREPLAPTPQPDAQALANQWNEDDFFNHLSDTSFNMRLDAHLASTASALPRPTASWRDSLPKRGVIIAGVAQPQDPQQYCEAIAYLSKQLGYPVLAEGLSPLRNYADRVPNLITTYDSVLRNSDRATQLAADAVIRIGDMPTSKVLRGWLATLSGPQWVVDPGDRNLDPLHGNTRHLRLSVEQLAALLQPEGKLTSPPSSPYLAQWLESEQQARATLDHQLAITEQLFEGKIAWLLSQTLPPTTSVFIANSTAVRDVEWFWRPNSLQLQPYFNRGANGIDGTLSTALGIAQHDRSGILLTGDLALLHDTNGFLLNKEFDGHLTIILSNNNGGGIFELLAIAQYDPPFETFFATPQKVNIAALCQAYGVTYHRVESWQQLAHLLNPLPLSGIRVLEVPTDRKADAQFRNTLFSNISDC